ncbi:MAG: small ribosomal subunit biogenesis GTPase RsgA [Nodosilinea sp.]
MEFPTPYPEPLPKKLLGVVTAVQANFYWVSLSKPAPAAPTPNQPFTQRLLCTRRARLKKIGQQVMVGDWVEVTDVDWSGGRGAIARVYPRQTILDRPPIANASQIALVFALASPDLEIHQLSRFLVKAESTGLRILLCLSKADLVSLQIRQDWQHRLQRWGYNPLMISLEEQDESTIGALTDHLKDQTTVISGPSGVGKSSLINCLIPQLNLKTGAVSGRLERGRHTTRHVELFELPGGGLLADSPGFNQPDLTIAPQDLGNHFPEIRLSQEPCQFKDCLHRQEPGCSVGAGWERYPVYLTWLEELIELQDYRVQRSHHQTRVKAKSREMGQVHHEPLLSVKKYRRTSRRRENQSLDQLRQSSSHGLEELD